MQELGVQRVEGERSDVFLEEGKDYFTVAGVQQQEVGVVGEE